MISCPAKRELKFERKQLKTEQQFRVKELRNQKKITRNSRPGLLALKPASYSVKQMRASAWQKAVNEDQDNDMLHAIDSAKRRIAEPVKDKISKGDTLTEVFTSDIEENLSSERFPPIITYKPAIRVLPLRFDILKIHISDKMKSSSTYT